MPPSARLIHVDCQKNPAWLTTALDALRQEGCAVVDRVLSVQRVQEISAAMYAVSEKIDRDISRGKRQAAGELGVLRLMLKYDPSLMLVLEIPEILAIVDASVSPTAILHLQNGFILPPTSPEAARIFQNKFHRDFPRYLNGYVASINVFLALDDYTTENGGTRVVLGSHQKEAAPDIAWMEQTAVTAECQAGSMIVFDSTLWHAAGINTSAKDRLGINLQFTRSFIKQQIDYVRAVGTAGVEAQPPRTQQLLGYYTRVVTSLDEYYQSEDKRLYRKNQG